MTRPKELNILIIADGVELGNSIRRILGERYAPVFFLTYSQATILLTTQRVQETGLFVLELFRSYPGGQRAEGLALAERWRKRKPSIVVSSLHLGYAMPCEAYWDTASTESLATRVERVARFPERCFEGFDRVLRCFKPLLEIPPQHIKISGPTI